MLTGEVTSEHGVLPAEFAAYDELPDGVVVADAAGRVIAVNAAAAALLGQPAADLAGRGLADALPLLDSAQRDWWTCLDPYHGLRTRTRMPERALTLGAGPHAGRQILVAARMVRDADLRVRRLVVTLRDGAARDRQDRERADLVSTTAHELRSPLTTIKGFTATLLNKWDRFTDEQKRLMLEMVNADADRVTRLITELLDVARIEAGRLELHRRPVDLRSLVEQVFAGMAATGEHLDRFTLDINGGLPEIWADPDKLLQVLGNLMDNAVRHGEGKVTVSIRADGTPQAPAGAQIVVSDEGTGIPEDIRDGVFGKFARGPLRGSTGLGLFIVRGIVQAHGGEISVSRGPGGGAVFRFTVPAGTPSFL
ncbi:MAG: HAMP domain-containing sensor histidine kinase [Pseudonocardiales bacterium]